jgi:hypothetical protein
MSDPGQAHDAQVFDRRLLGRRRTRAAAGLAGVDFLIRAVAERLAERVTDVRRRFPLALELGCHTGQLAVALGASGPVETLVQADLAPAMLRRAQGLKRACASTTGPSRLNGSLPRTGPTVRASSPIPI